MCVRTVVPDSVRVVCKNTNGGCVESVCSGSDLKPKAAVQTKMDSFGFGFFSNSLPSFVTRVESPS